MSAKLSGGCRAGILLLVGLNACLGGLPDPSPELYAQGRFVYRKNCAVCHGNYGDGQGEMAVGMKPVPRPFSAGIFKWHSTPPGTLPTDEDLMRTIRQGVPGSAMPTFSALPERDLRAVVNYLKTFSRKWRKPELHAAPVVLPPVPEWMGDEAALKEGAARAQPLFQNACAPCHGTKGDGAGTVKGLVDAWGQESVPGDLRKPLLRAGSGPGEIFRVLTLGIDGTPMPGFGETFFAEQRWEIVAFILEGRRRAAQE